MTAPDSTTDPVLLAARVAELEAELLAAREHGRRQAQETAAMFGRTRARLADAEREAAALRAEGERLRVMLRAVADTQMALACHDADAQRHAFGAEDAEFADAAAAQHEREWLEEQADDALAAVQSWAEENPAALAAPLVAVEGHRG